MPDKVRSVDEMVADMKKAVEEPAGSGSSAKHRQHVAQAIEKLISSQIIDGKLRYIEDGTGSKPTKGTAPALLPTHEIEREHERKHPESYHGESPGKSAGARA